MLLLFFSVPKEKWEAPIFLSNLIPVEVEETDSALLSCRVSAAPKPTVEWFKDNEPLQPSRFTKTEYDGRNCRLIFLETKLADTATYKCVLKNECGSTSSSAKLTVNVKTAGPEIIERPTEVIALEGSEARFDLKIRGEPAPNLEWSRANEPITDGGRFKIISEPETLSYSLIVSDLKMDDCGLYKVIASNKFGRAIALLDLTVKERLFAPEFLEEDGEWSKIVRKGGFVNITFTLRGNPRPFVTWYRDGKLLYDTTHMDIRSRGDIQYLNIFDVSSEDTGTYVCFAHSRLGSSFRSCTLKIRGMFETVNFKKKKRKTLLHTVLYFLFHIRFLMDVYFYR